MIRGRRCRALHRRKLIRIATGLAIALSADAASAASRSDDQVWLNVVTSGRIAGRIVGAFDAQLRLADGAQRVSQSVVRGWIGYRLSHGSIGAGYARVTLYQGGQANVVEDRVFQQAVWTAVVDRAAQITARGRLEERWRAASFTTSWRYRQFLRVEQPAQIHRLAAVVQAELFLNLNETSWGGDAGVDQVRAFAGVSAPLGKQVFLETGCQVQRKFGARPETDRVVPVTLTMRW